MIGQLLFCIRNYDMVLFDKKDPSADADTDAEQNQQTPLFQAVALIFIAGLCLSYLLSAAIVAGRFIEYHIPLFLMELPSSMICGIACFLFLAVICGLALQKSISSDGSSKRVLSRSQKISYFFSLLTTLCFTAYCCAVLVHLFKTGQFLSECMFLIILYICVLAVHLKVGKSPLAHLFTSAAFALILIVTAFYAGTASAKIENKKAGFVNREAVLLVSAQRDNYILVGYDGRKTRSNGKIIILPKQNSVLENTIFLPLGSKR